jgi:hypothetical protein
MEIYTKSREIGKDIRLFMGRFAINMYIDNEEQIKFKFTDYSNSNRAGRVKIKCI